MTAVRYDVIVIGGGVNGLTCAAMLGQAGLRTLLLERRDEVGGCATEHELAPGFRVPTLAHRTGPAARRRGRAAAPDAARAGALAATDSLHGALARWARAADLRQFRAGVRRDRRLVHARCRGMAGFHPVARRGWARGRLAVHPHPARRGRPWHARPVDPDAHAARLPGAAERRCVAAAAVGADGGGGSRQRVPGNRTAPCHGRGGRPAGRDDGAVVRRQRTAVAAARSERVGRRHARCRRGGWTSRGDERPAARRAASRRGRADGRDRDAGARSVPIAPSAWRSSPARPSSRVRWCPVWIPSGRSWRCAKPSICRPSSSGGSATCACAGRSRR